MRKPLTTLLPALVFTLSLPVSAAMSGGDEMEITMHEVSTDGVGDAIGSIQVIDHEHGVLFKPELEGLESGLHGFHLHEKSSCEPAEKNGKTVPAASAGGHFNPDKGNHNGPYQEGHVGDLPALYIGDDGNAAVPVLAPRLEYSDLAGHALIIHSGGDNYSDDPEKLGGGGARVACGTISEQ